MNEKHGIGFYGPQYRIYDTDRLRLPELAFDFDAANVLDDAITVSHDYPGDRAVLSMPDQLLPDK